MMKRDFKFSCVALFIALSSPITSSAAENIEVASTLSETECSGSNYYLVDNLYSKQQIEWIKNVLQFAYNNESIGGCEFDEFTKEKFSLSEMESLLRNRQFCNFFGKELVERITRLMQIKSSLLQNKTKLESISNPEKICKSSAIQSYTQQQAYLLEEMVKIFKIHSTVNPLAADCD